MFKFLFWDIKVKPFKNGYVQGYKTRWIQNIKDYTP